MSLPLLLYYVNCNNIKFHDCARSHEVTMTAYQLSIDLFVLTEYYIY